MGAPARSWLLRVVLSLVALAGAGAVLSLSAPLWPRVATLLSIVAEALAAGLRVAALPGEGTTRAGDHWSLAEVARGEAGDAYAEALGARAVTP